MCYCKVLVCGLLSLSAMIVSAHGGQDSSSTLTLDEARRALLAPSGSLAKIPLAEFESYREVDIGGNRRVLAISCSHSGGLIAFGSDGKAIVSAQTGKITSFQVFDLAEDGNSMIVIDEIAGTGTGLLKKDFSMYRVTSSEIRKIWTGESFFRSAPWNPSGNIQITEKRCFVRFDPTSAAIEATFTHACVTGDGRHLIMKIYEWREGSLKDRKPNP
jgi:hypothetical protein